MKNVYFYDTIIGKLRIADNGEGIIEIGVETGASSKNLVGADFAGIPVRSDTNLPSPGCRVNETPLIKKAYTQLSEYFSGNRKTFNLPLKLEGTEFQKKVWQALIDIPYGETRSYKQIAEAVGCPKGCRAVGNANNKNKILIMVPCHRVIGANGDLVGFGAGLDVKKKLLYIEKIM